MKNLITKYLTTLSGILLGGIGGYIYWRYIGCESGTCPITSSNQQRTMGYAYGRIII